MALPDKAQSWVNSDDIRPYVYMRRENRIKGPGQIHQCDWFDTNVIYKDPLHMDEVQFADSILNLESKAFNASAMPMPRWVFYDCAVIPGFVCGFAHKTSSLPDYVKEALGKSYDLDWTPVSLFIIIPTARPGEWVAHNLCTVNSLLEQKNKFYALGFLSKAFALWYANIEILCGMTQWKSPAVRLHCNYGPFEVLTAYTPVHSYPRTLTYRTRLDARYWASFFTKEYDFPFEKYLNPEFVVDPVQDESLIGFQRKIEAGQGPYYFNPKEVRTQDLNTALNVYRLADSVK